MFPLTPGHQTSFHVFDLWQKADGASGGGTRWGRELGTFTDSVPGVRLRTHETRVFKLVSTEDDAQERVQVPMQIPEW